MIPVNEAKVINKEVMIPISLYQSLRGKYFVGYADQVNASQETNAWAGLFNPTGSEIILHVNVITITNVVGEPFSAEIWFNALFPGIPIRSDQFTPANTAIQPLSKPKTAILLTSDVPPIPPSGGVKINAQPVLAHTTIVFEEEGKYIFPPGGSLVVYLNLIGSATTGRVAFGWWEESFVRPCDNCQVQERVWG